jgi:tetratricopeptide (TPR) repeat protein
MPLSTHPILRAVAWLSAALMIVGCSSADSRAQAALGEYQAAAAANDMWSARNALLKLVRAKDDVADYWAELGKVQASMGSYGDAYYAFTRAYELDRSNPELVKALTELALRSGDIGMAQAHAQELEILNPGDPWVKLVKGWAAFSESRFDEALSVSDELLAASPFDPSATVLKARALTGLNREDEALDLLTKQVKSQPADTGSLMLLAKIYQRRTDWPKVAEITRQIAQLSPQDQQNMLIMVEAALRSGNVALARETSFKLLQPQADATLVSSVLDRWADYWPSPQRVEDARRLANSVGARQRLLYAAFLSRVGSPGDAVRLVGTAATLPVNAGNADANAIVGDALMRGGKLAEAKPRLDAVIAFDPGNSIALRARAELEIRIRQTDAAVEDAQKLVTVLPTSARDRLLLARAYSAAGNRPWTERTLWAAFQDIPGDDNIYSALRSTRSGNAEAMNQLEAEFERQRAAKLNRGLL